MIRWKYAGPRLALLGLVLLIYWLALDPLVRRAIVATGQRLTGARVDLERVDASLLRTELHLRDLAVADPARPMQNLFEAGDVTLDLETGPLLDRKFVVREARVEGLAFGTPRKTSGALDGAAGILPLDMDAHQLADAGLDWLDAVAGRLREDLADEFESVKLVRGMADRWPGEYDALCRRAESLEGRAQGLRQSMDRIAAEGNPLRRVELVRQTADEVEQLAAELDGIRREIDRLAGQVDADRRALADAAQRDAERVRHIARLEEIDPDRLSYYLLGNEAYGRVATAVDWVRRVRQYMPADKKAPAAVRERGVTFAFDDRRQTPDFLIRSMSVDGYGRWDGRPFEFQGTLEGLTHQPVRYGYPAKIAAQVHGAAEMSLAITIDRTDTTPRDRIAIDVPRLSQPEVTLGRKGRLAVIVPPGEAAIHAQIELAGDDVAGRMTFRRTGVDLAADVGPDLGGKRLARPLGDVLAEVDDLQATVVLSGPLERPRWTLETDMGDRLARALHRAVRAELEAYRDELVAEAERRVRAELAELDQRVAAQRDTVLRRLQLGDAEIAELQRLVAERVQLPESLTGKGSPIGRFLR